MSVSKALFGHTKDGQPVFCYTLTNEHGVEVRVLSYGAALQSVLVPSATGSGWMSSSGTTQFQSMRSGTASSALWWGGLPTVCARRALCWTGRPGSSSPTRERTTSTAASPSAIMRGRWGGQPDLFLPQPRRGGGIPGQPSGHLPLHSDGRRPAGTGLPGDDGPRHDPQPDQPRLLESQRSRFRLCAGHGLADGLQPVYRDGCGEPAHRRCFARGRNPL